MHIGVCYFPEHWPQERWETDVREMAAAGFEYVRMGEFAWSRLEPERGEFDVEWLERAVDLVGEHGMQAVLCTPTATPPKWLVDEHPSIRQVEDDGTVRDFGSRRHYCFNSSAYRDETERIVRVLADQFEDHSVVGGWQIDNEYGCHDTIRCYCEDCADTFRTWLADRYGTIGALNEAWGTTFWSQRYGSFGEVDPPRYTAADHHPSRLLDYYRFSSDSVVEYNRLQADLLRRANDNWFLTHNFMGQFGALDSFDVREDLDLATWDSYPTGFAQSADEPSEAAYRAGDPDQVGLSHDLYRDPDVPFWVMEQQPGDINWSPHAPQPADGAMRLWAHHAVAHGADAVLYFRWRRCLEGQEQYHAGLRKQDGTPDRGYGDAKRAAAELPTAAPTQAQVAILHDYDNLWALEIQPHDVHFDYWEHFETYYQALRERSVTVDIVPPSTVLENYELIVAPTLHLVDDETATRLRAYVEGGGHLIVTARSGVKDPTNKLRVEPAPGPLSGLTGVTVDQHETIPPALEAAVSSDNERYDYRLWGEWLSPTDAEVVATHATGVASGRPAITTVERGSGTVTYVGVWPGPDLAATVVGDVLTRVDVPTTERLPNGVRITARDDHAWITNFTDRNARVDVPDGCSWTLGSEHVSPYDCVIVEADVDEVGVTLEQQ